jgi:hypothetical protein
MFTQPAKSCSMSNAYNNNNNDNDNNSLFVLLWTGHILRRICLPRQVIEGKIKGEKEVKEDEEEDVGCCCMTLRKDGNNYFVLLWTDHILHRNCLARQNIEGKIKWEKEVKEDEEEDVGS